MSEKKHYRGRLSQIWIYFGKLVRMFIFQRDWKVLPMAAIIAGLVTFAVGTNMFKTQEGTYSGCFALICVGIWNGFFNSIEVICRERPIIKREHRAGLHITSYIASHMLWQMFLCLAQTGITLFICNLAGIQFPEKGLLTEYGMFDFGLCMFLVTYTADMLSLAISAIVRNTTAAMTVMPFVLMFQLVFSGGLMPLKGAPAKLSNFTITKWGLNTLCTLGDYNSQPQVTLWNTMWQFRSFEMGGQQPVKLYTDYVRKNGLLKDFLLESGKYTMSADFDYTQENLMKCILMLLLMAAVFVIVATIFLEFIDRDKK